MHSEETKEKIRQALKGKKRPKKVREKISKTLSGRKVPESVKQKIRKATAGENNFWYGKSLSEKHKQKISKSKTNVSWGKHSKETIKKFQELNKRESNPNWKGGIACEPYCDAWLDKDFKENIKERDGNICLNPACDGTCDRLCLHHINYNKKDCRPSNLITICISCNGKANSNRNWHKSWYKTILYNRYGI